MSESENYDCYEGIDYIIHVPSHEFRITGPKFKYATIDSNQDYNSYFIKTTSNDDQLEQTLNKGYVKIDKNNFERIMDIWSPFLGLLLSESKYF